MIDDPLNTTKTRRGADIHTVKLTEDDVRNIREIIEDRKTMKQMVDDIRQKTKNEIDALNKKIKDISNKKIAEKYDVHIRTIDKVSQGYTWSHVK